MHKAVKDIQNIMGKAVDTILPPRCVVTGTYVDRQGMVSPQAWRELSFITTPYCVSCGVPLAFEMGGGSICAPCTQSMPSFDKARSALIYDDSSRNIILRFKHADQTHAVHAFIPWILRAGHEFIEDADFIVPVPLHRYRLLKRRYNQAALIARELAKETAGTYVADLLQRRRSTPSQGYMNFKERHKNVKNAFVISPRHALKIRGKSIVLVDDVYTTGATVKECTKILKKAGASKVYVLTLARTVRSEMDF